MLTRAAACVALLTLCQTAWAAVRNLNTGETFNTIQGAIADPQTLDTHVIEADAATYVENVTINKSITLRGATGNATQVIVNPASGLAINVAAAAVTIRHLTVTDGNAGIATNLLAIATSLTLDNVVANANTGDGINISNVSSVTLTDVSANGNGGMGLNIAHVGTVNVSRTDATANTHGFSLSTATSLTISGTTANRADFSGNRDHGIRLIDISGNVTLNSVAAEANDSDNNNIGDGLNASDGPDGDDAAIGGNLVIGGSGFHGNRNGVLVARLGGSLSSQLVATIGNAASSNELDGLAVTGGTTASFTNGGFNGNGQDGIDLIGFSGAVSMNGVGATSNGSDGLELDSLGDLTLTNVTAAGNSSDGVDAGAIPSLTVSDGTFSGNAADGFLLAGVAAVTVNSAGISQNGQSGVQLTSATTFSDTDSIVSGNDDHGIQLTDISGDVTLTRTISADNNADSDTAGDGLRAADGGDANTIAIGGALILRGAKFLATEAADADEQLNGVSVAGVGGSVTVEPSGDTNADFTGHAQDGLSISNAGAIGISGVTANQNAGDGISLVSVGAVTIGLVTMDQNGIGLFIEGGASLAITGTPAVTSSFLRSATDGIKLVDIAGNVSLTHVSSEQNDFDNNSTGDGLNASDGGDGDTLAIGGNLTIAGSALRSNRRGVFAARLGGSFTSEIANDLVNDISSNKADGMEVGGGTFATFNGSNHSNNGTSGFDDGIDLGNFTQGVTLTNVLARDNKGDGIEVSGVPALTVTGGRYNTNLQNGIDSLSAAQVSLTDVTASNNAFAGVSAGVTGASTVTRGAFLSNGTRGLFLTGSGPAAQLALVGPGSASQNANDGLNATQLPAGVSVSAWTFNNNGGGAAAGEGIELTAVGAAVFGGVTANGNDVGARLVTALSFSDADGTYANNDDHGISMVDVAGSVALTRTTAENNNRDSDAIGDGVSISDGADGDTVAVGGNLTIQGARFRGTDSGDADEQLHGLRVTPVGGNVVMESSGAQPVEATGNAEDGVFIEGRAEADLLASISSGIYSNNGRDGLRMATVDGVSISNVVANSNDRTALRVTQFGSASIVNCTMNSNPGGGIVAFSDEPLPTLTLSDLTLTGNGANRTFASATTMNFTATSGSTGETVTVIPGQPADPSFIQFTRGGVAQDPIAFGEIQTLNIFGGSGADTFNVRAAEGFAINIDGNDPGGSSGDTLNYNAEGRVVTIDADTVESPGVQPVNFTEIEDTNFLDPQPADLSIEKAAAATHTARDPDGLDYVLTVKNNGPSDNTGFTVTDVLPNGVEFRQEGSSPGATVSGQSVTFTNTTGLQVGETQTFTIRVSVPKAAGGTVLNNVASVATSGFPDSTSDNNTSNAVQTAIRSAPQSVNIATRSRVETAERVMIAGMIITGDVPKRVLVRAVGPSLLAAGVNDALLDPALELYAADGTLVSANNNWKDTQQAEIEASTIAPSEDREAAIIAELAPGSYTAMLFGQDETTGIAVAEVYDLDAVAESALANISTRAVVRTGENVMIGGFILGGDVNSRVVVRALGPSLGAAGVADALPDPTLDLRDGNGERVAFNENWEDNSAQAAEISALGLQPPDDVESAIFASLSPGAYTAIVEGKGGATGIGLVEIYNVP